MITKILNTAGLPALALLLAACANQPASGPDPHPEPLPDQGLIYFYRPLADAMPEVEFSVREDDRVLGRLSAGGYFYTYSRPGRHYYTMHPHQPLVDGGEGGVVVQVRAGDTHFVLGRGHPEPTRTRALVSEVFPAQARPELQRLEFRPPK